MGLLWRRWCWHYHQTSPALSIISAEHPSTFNQNLFRSFRSWTTRGDNEDGLSLSRSCDTVCRRLALAGDHRRWRRRRQQQWQSYSRQILSIRTVESLSVPPPHPWTRLRISRPQGSPKACHIRTSWRTFWLLQIAVAVTYLSSGSIHMFTHTRMTRQTIKTYRGPLSWMSIWISMPSAKQVLLDLQPTNIPRQQAFPLESVCVFAGPWKITADMGHQMQFLAHRKLARAWFQQMHILGAHCLWFSGLGDGT